MTWIRNVGAALLALLVALAIGANLALAQSGGGSVTIADFQFTPSTLQVPQGTTVTWTNNGPSNHTTTSDTGVWDSGALQPGKTFNFKFNTPGTFAYHCSIHPTMKGTITVTAAASPASSAAASQAPAPSSPPATAASPSPSPVASTGAASQASPSPTPSKTSAPAQLPKTGGGGPGTPASKLPWALLGLVPLLGAGAWGVRRARGARRT